MVDKQMIHLRALERRDMPILQKWMNDSELTRWLGHHFPISLEEQNRWFDKLIVDTTKKKLLIEDLENHPIGLVSLMQINFKDRSAEFGIYLGEHQFSGKGFGYEATISMLKLAFHELGLIRVYLVVLEENDRAIKSFIKSGFKKEAVLRESCFFDGKFHNQVIMGILAEEFEAIPH